MKRMNYSQLLLIRPAAAQDEQTVLRLAALDDAPAPHGDVLLAEVDGQAVAALDRESGAVVADPFRPTAAIVRALSAIAA
jgi:hypothetical protein